MSEEKSKLIRMVSFEDLFLILLSWVAKKFLDFLWAKGKARIRFEGKTHFGRYLFVMFGENVLMFMFGWLLDSSKSTDSSESRELFRRFLRLHKRYHQFKGDRLCCVCYNVIFFRSFLEKYVSDSRLYPPFKFFKK